MYRLKQKVQKVTVSEIWRNCDMANYFNSEKYPDPTAYAAIKNIEKQKKLKQKLKKIQKSKDKEVK